jgi:SAM-dependent methyltransferase
MAMLNEEVKAIWNANAEYWDGRMGEGNAFHKTLIEPAQLKLLNVESGQRILDIACGNGQFARKMAALGAHVLATDFSERMIQLARSRPDRNIEYAIVDATKQQELAKLPDQFDAVVSTMAIMDIETIAPLAGDLRRLLKRDGAFVFSIMHPCFNSLCTALWHERDEDEGNIRDTYGVKVSDYMTERSGLGVAMAGQPRLQYYFHRPVSVLLKTFFDAGFVMDGYEEPSFPDLHTERIFDNVYRSIPAALVCRLRPGLR